MAGSADNRFAKQRLRQELRAGRRSLDAESAARARDALASHGLGTMSLAGARTVAGYMASDGELDVSELLRALRTRGAHTLLPRWLRGEEIELASADDETELHASAHGILEPEGPPVSLEGSSHPAVLLVPCVALDRSGARLGRGGGAYDRFIPRVRALGWHVIGVCHAAHVLDRLPIEPHDQSVDAILTERGLISV